MKIKILFRNWKILWRLQTLKKIDAMSKNWNICLINSLFWIFVVYKLMEKVFNLNPSHFANRFKEIWKTIYETEEELRVLVTSKNFWCFFSFSHKLLSLVF